MTPLDYGSLQVRSSWLAQVRKSKKSILLGAGDPPVLLSHFIVAIAHHVKVYGQHGAVCQRFNMACKVVNYGVHLNRFVVPNQQYGGSRLKDITRDTYVDWVKELCQNFAGVESERYYQGDGTISNVDELLGDVPSHAATDGANKSACQLYEFHLYTLKAQKDLGLYKLSESDRAKEAARSALMGDINRVTQGLLYFVLFLLHYYYSG
jgi:hypothetical protein